MERIQTKLKPLEIDYNLTVKEALDRVLRLPSVASKRYLTNKVSRLANNRQLALTKYLTLNFIFNAILSYILVK